MIVIFTQDGVCSPEDIDTAVTQALGLRYSIIGVFETIHLNAAGEEVSLTDY